MAATYKNARIQGTSSTSTYANLYTVPTGKAAVISTIGITNASSSNIIYRVAITDSNTTPTAEDWLIYDSTVAANDSTFVTIGITLTAGQYLKVSSSSNSSAFSCFLSEIS